MKKMLMALGAIIIIIGLITTTWTATLRNKIVTYNYTYQTTDSWEVTGNLSAGDRLTLSITPGLNWGVYAEPPDPSRGFLPGTGIFEILVSVVDPRGGNSNFTFVFITSSSSENLIPPLQPFGAMIDSSNGALTMENENFFVKINQTMYYRTVGGIVSYDGVYKIVINREVPAPPRYLKLLKEEITVEWPYLFVVPIGGTIMGSGIVLSAWAAKKPKHRTDQRIRKNK